MSVRDSQGRMGDDKEISFAELCERARTNAADQASIEEKKKGNGLRFMAYQMNVADTHLDLAIKRKITPAESNLLRVLELCTIGARNSRKQICSKAMVHISDLSQKLGYKEKDKIWKLLKSLEKKGYLIREKTRNKDQEILGLNPKTFGQILIDQQFEREKKRHLSLVPKESFPTHESSVDNTQRPVDNSTDRSSTTPTDSPLSADEASVLNGQIICDEPTDRPCSDFQIPEMIVENPLLDSSRSILDSSRGLSGNQEETHVSSNGSGSKKRTPEEHLKIIQEQVALAKAGKL